VIRRSLFWSLASNPACLIAALCASVGSNTTTKLTPSFLSVERMRALYCPSPLSLDWPSASTVLPSSRSFRISHAAYCSRGSVWREGCSISFEVSRWGLSSAAEASPARTSVRAPMVRMVGSSRFTCLDDDRRQRQRFSLTPALAMLGAEQTALASVLAAFARAEHQIGRLGPASLAAVASDHGCTCMECPCTPKTGATRCFSSI
jgi:hypothetical protein